MLLIYKDNLLFIRNSMSDGQWTHMGIDKTSNVDGRFIWKTVYYILGLLAHIWLYKCIFSYYKI